MLARSVALAAVLSIHGCLKITTDDQRAGREQPAAPSDAPARGAREPGTVRAAPSTAPAAAVADAEPTAEPAADVGGFEVRAPVAAAPIGVTVLDAGSEPKAQLRVLGTPGQKRKLRVSLGLKAAMHLGTRDVPPTELPALQVLLDAEVTASDATRTTIAIAVTEVIVPADAPASARVQQAITRTADELRATKGDIVLAANGRIESFALAASADAAKRHAGLEPELGGLAAALQEMLPVLPDEPVGDGARWRAVQQVRRDTALLQQVTEWTAKREGDTLVLASTSEHDLVAPTEGTERGGGGIVEAQSGTTRARVVWTPASVLPQRAEAEVTTTTRANMELVGAAQRVSMRVELSLRLDAAE